MRSSASERRSSRSARGSSARGGAGASGADAALLELIAISHAVGSDPDLVQGGGGNTSVKGRDGRRMLVKASGTALAAMDETRGWAELDLEAARRILDRRETAALPAAEREAEVLRLLQAAVIRPRGARPSVESCLHALLERVVIHTHPVGLNALLCSRDSRRLAEALCRRLGTEPLHVEYVDPGFTLAARLKEEIAAYEARHGRPPRAVLLDNHGLFVAAPEAEECLELSRKLTGAGQRWLGRARVNPLEFALVSGLDGRRNGTGVERIAGRAVLVRGALLRGGAAPALVRRDASRDAEELARRQASVAAARKGAFTPDQIVYCRTAPLALPARPEKWAEAVAAYRRRRGLDPRVVIVPGDGVYYAAADLAQLKVVAEVYRGAIAALLAAPKAGGPRFLKRREAGFIESWEVETFRAALLARGGRTLEGRVALVTGAASGLGKGIALELIGAGATVLGLDLDAASLGETAAAQPPGRFLPLPASVTDEDSVRAAFAAAEASAGGLDFLVNAAGIAPSYPLVDFPLAAWKKTLDINLTGYFLCAREAARLLLRQGAGGVIINLTSKSGLDASRENSAYNATKAGEIHLMRGWALELGRAGIRVNCVAPGNVFKGSRIWNEEYIRACARKKGIRPEEVIPYYTSLSALGKEIEPRDVAAAVLFLLSDEARNITGQTLVVDGGQVMVR
jgi:NAD(P)-dependent dehydrogenase (short-subunit alcohol dehydrogenase family)/rhamnose utilization protein RhaD (predicted bifunctional aldolase and dehydrogenase)